MLLCENGKERSRWESCRILWRLCHENMPAVNHCPLTSIHAETGALHNHTRRGLLLQKMLCFEFPKQTKETLSALHTRERRQGERDLSGASGLILTEWALQVKFPEFLNLCVMTTRLAFLSNTGFCSSWNFRYRVVDQNHSFILFCLINMLGILSLDAGLSFNSANPQRASGGFSCWGCQEQ